MGVPAALRGRPLPLLPPRPDCPSAAPAPASSAPATGTSGRGSSTGVDAVRCSGGDAGGRGDAGGASAMGQRLGKRTPPPPALPLSLFLSLSQPKPAQDAAASRLAGGAHKNNEIGEQTK